MCYAPLREYGVQALADCREGRATHALEQAALAILVSTGLVSRSMSGPETVSWSTALRYSRSSGTSISRSVVGISSLSSPF